jgi:thiol-disulfide isomerase/thioredoxin
MFPNTAFTQEDTCNLIQSSYSELYTVVPENVRCIAQNSDKDITVFFTFSGSCSPCRKHLPEAVQLAKEQNTNFYLLITDRENDEYIEKTIAIAKQIVPEEKLKMVIISDSLYSPGKRYKKRKSFISISTVIQEKYTQFLNEITPAQFENIANMSKYIVLNKQGEVIFISNYKDAEGEKNDLKVREKIIKFIENDRQSRTV